MPNTTSSTMKNTYGNRRSRRKKTSNFDRKVQSIALKTIANHEKKVREMKTYDAPEVVGDSITNTGTVYNLSLAISQGDAFNQREGDEVILKGLQVRLQVATNPGASYNSMRVVVFRWNSIGIPTTSTVFESTTSSLIRHLSPSSNGNKKHLQILYDNIFQVADTLNYNISALALDKFYIKLAGKAIWNPDASNNGGHIYMACLSDSALVDAPEISYVSRLRYVDP